MTAGFVALAGSVSVAARASESIENTESSIAGNTELNNRQQALLASADLLEAYGREADSESYTSVSISPESNSVKVWRTGQGSTEKESLYRALVKDTTLEFGNSVLTEVEGSVLRDKLRAVRERLEQDSNVYMTRWSMTSAGIFEVKFDPAYRVPAVGEIPGLTEKEASAIVVGEGGPVLSLGRLSDVSPYYGGSRVQLPDDKKCSTGFGVRSRATGSHYITSAWHCDKYGDFRFWNGQGGCCFMGFARDNFYTDIDTALINLSYQGTKSDEFIFDGFYPNSGQTKQVSGVAAPRVGMLVCTSGSFSYANCSGQVTETVSDWVLEDLWKTRRPSVHGMEVSTLNGRNSIAVTGDSGGPVFQNVSNDTRAVAIGAISGAAAEWQVGVTCPSHLQGQNFGCAYKIYAISMSEVADRWGLNFVGI